MTRHRRSYYRKPAANAGYEQAKRHIEAARKLTAELGGADEDVKKYFFNLSAGDLEVVLRAYEREHGSDARNYAQDTIPKWQSGRVTMSGMVAERLFGLLPPMMPMESKYALSASLWDFVAPTSHHTFLVGPDANLETLANDIRSYIMALAAPHEYPDTMHKRFQWLSQGDIGVQTQLRAYLRDRERQLMLDLCNQQLPAFVREIGRTDGLSRSIRHTLKFKKHHCHILFAPHLRGIEQREGQYTPTPPRGFNWAPIFWIAAALLMLFFFAGGHRHH